MNLISRELKLFKRSGGFWIGLVTPLILILCIGVTMTGTVTHIPIGVTSGSAKMQSAVSSALSDSDFTVSNISQSKVTPMMVSGKLRAVVEVISSNSSYVKIKLLIDSTDTTLKDQVRYSVTTKLFEYFNKQQMRLDLDVNFKYSNYNFLVYLAPGILILGILFGGLFIAGDTILNEKEDNTLENVIVSGFSPMRFTMEKLLSFFITMSISPILSFILIVIIGGIIPSISAIALTTLIIILCSFIFVSFGIALSTYLPNKQVAGAVMGTVIFPFMFVSGVFLSIFTMKSFVIPFAKYNPMTLGTEALRTVLLKHGEFQSILNSTLLLLIFGVIMFIWAVRRINKVLAHIQE